jgi:cytochrome o ubiquinol oxidase operon protein cyoD
MIGAQEKNTEQRSMASYVTGFILSLILTIVPYYLVTHHIVSGTKLLITILGFAVVQLFVQVIFFLHLGRGPKPRWNVYFFAAAISIILVVVGGSIVIINNLHGNIAAPDQTRRLVNDEGIYQVGGVATGACRGQHPNHKLTIQNDKVTTPLVVANLCDTLTFINKDGIDLEITFGTHEHHSAYAGITTFALLKSKPNTITLSELGTFHFHDHERPQISGNFAVVKALSDQKVE